MPWTARDAYSHTKKASTPALQAQWSTIANSHLEKTGDEAAAIKIANAAIDSKPTKKGPVNARKPAPFKPVAKPPGPSGLPSSQGMAAPQSLPGRGKMGMPAKSGGNY